MRFFPGRGPDAVESVTRAAVALEFDTFGWGGGGERSGRAVNEVMLRRGGAWE